MKEKKRIGFTSQDYEPPRTEAIAVAQESILCASPSDINGGLEGFTTGDGLWDGLGGGLEGFATGGGAWGGFGGGSEGPEGMTTTNGSW